MAQLLHQEYTAASFQLNAGITRRVRDVFRIETTPFVRDDKLNAVGFLMTGHPDLFLLVKPVAMHHGIIDRFRQTDEDIGMQVLIDVQPFHEPFDKVFDFANATGVRGQF